MRAVNDASSPAEGRGFPGDMQTLDPGERSRPERWTMRGHWWHRTYSLERVNQITP